MKGQAEITEIIIILALAAFTIALIPILLNLIQDFFKIFALASPEIVSRDLAGLMTISAAAPNNITLYYKIYAEGISYDFDSHDRKVNVKLLDEDQKMIKEASSIIPIDITSSLENVKEFKIIKTRESGRNYFRVVENE